VSSYKPPKKRPTYYSYLLRLRWVANAVQQVWRISLEEPANQTQLHFDSLAAMCTYLANQLELAEEVGEEANDKSV
jgi:hypothetical protein